MKIELIKRFKCSQNGFEVKTLEPGIHHLSKYLCDRAVEKGFGTIIIDSVETKVVNVEETKEDLKNLTVKELKSKCKELGIKGYSNKKEYELIELIKAAK